MSRTRYAVVLPAGWSGGGLSYSHRSGALVMRDSNPSTGLIEWVSLDATADRIEYHGQDLHSAFEAAASPTAPTPTKENTHA